MKDLVLEIRIWHNPERMGGWWCFEGTRIPIETLDKFLEGHIGFGGNAKFNKRKFKSDFPDLYNLLFIK